MVIKKGIENQEPHIVLMEDLPMRRDHPVNMAEVNTVLVLTINKIAQIIVDLPMATIAMREESFNKGLTDHKTIIAKAIMVAMIDQIVNINHAIAALLKVVPVDIDKIIDLAVTMAIARNMVAHPVVDMRTVLKAAMRIAKVVVMTIVVHMNNALIIDLAEIMGIVHNMVVLPEADMIIMTEGQDNSMIVVDMASKE
jgi:hypothetical protein